MRPETSPPQRGLLERPVDRAPSREVRLLLWMQLPANPIAPSVARLRMRRWLTGLRWPAGQLDDLVVNQRVATDPRPLDALITGDLSSKSS